MRASILILVLFLNSFICYSQDVVTIKGTVISSDKEELSGYNIMLYNPGDSIFYKGDYFMNSSFSIKTAKLPVRMKISSMGFRDTTLIVDKNHLVLSQIRLHTASNLLKEVVVKAGVPVITGKSDRIVMNVENTVLSQAGTAIDVLQKAARVMIGTDNEVSVLGVGNALIVVDGRTLSANQALESISSSDIQKIDIITNPSSKYDAEGKAVILITTKKAKQAGWGAEVTGRLGHGKDMRKYIGTELSIKSSKLALFGSYAYVPEKRIITENYILDYQATDSPYYVSKSIRTKNNTQDNHKFRAALDYNLLPEHTVGIQLNGQFRDTKKNIMNNSLVSYSGMDDYSISSLQNSKYNRTYLAGTAYYTYTPKLGKSQLNVLYDQSHFNTKENMDITENNIQKNNNVKTTIDINSIKADFETQFGDEYHVNLGGKYTHTRNASTTRFINNGIENRNIDYKYREGISAAYAILSKQYEKFNFEAGLRAEVFDDFAKTDVVVQNENNFNLFPSLTLGYKLTHDWAVSSSYAMKITRPSFQDMNPAINYIDSLCYFQGNPKLISELRHTACLKLVYKGAASLALNYTHKKHMLGWYVEQDAESPSVTKASQKNIDKSDVFSVDLMLPYQSRFMTCYLATGVILTNSTDKASNIINMNKPMWYAYPGTDFTLPGNFKLGINVKYFTKGVENIFYFDPVFRTDLSLQKSFMKGKLNATILWNDVFKSDKMNTYTTLNEQYIRYHYYYDQSLVQLSLTYKFSSSKAKYKSKSAINAETERIKEFKD